MFVDCSPESEGPMVAALHVGNEQRNAALSARSFRTAGWKSIRLINGERTLSTSWSATIKQDRKFTKKRCSICPNRSYVMNSQLSISCAGPIAANAIQILFCEVMWYGRRHPRSLRKEIPVKHFCLLVCQRGYIVLRHDQFLDCHPSFVVRRFSTDIAIQR